MNNKKKATKISMVPLVEEDVMCRKKVTKIPKQVETKTKFYLRETSHGLCPKCKSSDWRFDGRCPIDITDNGDGEGRFDAFFICKKCGLVFQDVWEARYIRTEDEEDVVGGIVSGENNGGESDE